MSSIAEGFERNKRTEFHQFLSVSKASCAELRSRLYVALDSEFITADEFKRLQEQAEEVGRILGALRARVQEQRANQNR